MEEKLCGGDEARADAGRVERMEEAMDTAARAVKTLSDALDVWEAAQRKIMSLADYLGSGEWKADRAADEFGRLPKEMKRGVLSEDAAYNVLSERDDVIERLREAVKSYEDDQWRRIMG